MPSASLASLVLAALLHHGLALPHAEPVAPVESFNRVGRVRIPHRARQVISNDGFDVMHHLSGTSPYFNSPGVGLTAGVPPGCSVTAATYLVRHADIYANDFEYENTISPFLQKLGNFSDRAAFSGEPSLAFLANWTSPIDDPEKQLEKVTDTGKADARALGALFAQRYHDILGVNGTQPFRFWSADASRDQTTARSFVSSFNSSLPTAELVIVDEGKNQSANTLTPHGSCSAFDTSVGSDEEETFIATYAPTTAARLNGLAAPSFNWTADDVFAAQSLCGYDAVIRNYTSPFCALFTESEWLAWEYANDLMYHRSLGYGNPLAPTLGMPWISASARLLAGTADVSATNSSAGKQSLFISFTHREEPPFIVTALGLFNTSNASMPADALNYERVWRTSDILPFLANVGLERLECNASATPTNASGVFVRVLVNAAPMPLPGCSSGPDASCALANFTQFVADREARYGDFVDVCGGAKAGNATSTLGLYEGVLPADGAAVQVVAVAFDGKTDAANSSTSTVKKSGAAPVRASGHGALLVAMTLVGSALIVF